MKQYYSNIKVVTFITRIIIIIIIIIIDILGLSIFIIINVTHFYFIHWKISDMKL